MATSKNHFLYFKFSKHSFTGVKSSFKNLKSLDKPIFIEHLIIMPKAKIIYQSKDKESRKAIKISCQILCRAKSK